MNPLLPLSFRIALLVSRTLAFGDLVERATQTNIEKERSLDGIYVIRTNVSAEVFSSELAVRNYKSLSGVERAIHHREPDRVRAHIFLCMLAYYVEWHMRQDPAPLLFDDHDRAAAEHARTSVVAPAQRSTSAQQKAYSKRTPDDLPVHSFQTLPSDLATIVTNRVQPKDASIPASDVITTPTAIQQRALDLLARWNFGPTELGRILEVQSRLRALHSEDHHANCHVWAIFRAVKW